MLLITVALKISNIQFLEYFKYSTADINNLKMLTWQDAYFEYYIYICCYMSNCIVAYWVVEYMSTSIEILDIVNI
jgi:hypothetical protein